MLQYKELLAVCVDALHHFDVKSQSVEEYIRNYLKALKDLDDDDHVFIVEVFSGCVQYSKVLKVVVEGFFATDGKTCSRVDTELYNVLCYMIVFRLDELGLAHLNKFMDSQNVLKMHRFLKFFISDENLTHWIYDQWCKQYDKIFVDEEIVKPITRWKQDLDFTVQRLENKINNKVRKKFERIPPTQTKPFNLTKPKPKSIPVPERLPNVAKTKPVPKKIFQEPIEKQKLMKQKEENQRRAEHLLLLANEDQFVCAHSEKSLKTQIKMQSLMDEEDQKLNFNMKHSKPLLEYKTDNKPIKLNTATVLREGALFQKKEQQELEKLEKILRGERNASDFLEWQKGMQQKDMEERLVEEEQKRVMGKLSREEAILAKQNHIREKQKMVTQWKFENAKMMQDYLAMRLDEEKQMRTLVENITDGHHNTQEARLQLQEYKRQIVQEVNHENRELMRRALEEAEEEMTRKSKLIQEIRAMESVPVNRGKLVDLTSTAGYDFLSEMSIAELKERLSLMKEAHQREMDAKKDSILKEKQAKNEAMMETIARISVHRNEMSKAAKLKAEDRIRRQQMQQDKVKQDERVRVLQEKLQQKKEERLRRANELYVNPSKKTSTITQGLIRDKKRLETKRWLQLEKSFQRHAEEKIRSPSSKSSSRIVEGKFQGTQMLKGF